MILLCIQSVLPAVSTVSPSSFRHCRVRFYTSQVLDILSKTAVYRPEQSALTREGGGGITSKIYDAFILQGWLKQP